MSMLRKLYGWLSSLEGKFMLTAFLSVALISAAAGLTILSREERLYKIDSQHQGFTISEISRLTLTNMLVFNEMGIVSRQDLMDFLDYFILNLKERDRRVFAVTIFNDKGAVLTDNNVTGYKTANDDKDLARAFTSFLPVLTEETVAGRRAIIITTPLNIDTKCWGALRFAFSTEEVHRAVRHLRNQIMLFTLGVLFISLVIAKIVARKLTEPVVLLTKTMDSAQKHWDMEVTAPLFPKRRDEIGELQSSFFWFLKRLREAHREREKVMEQLVLTEKLAAIGHLSAGVAHEINNPLGGVTICFKSLLKYTEETEETGQLVYAIEDGLKKIKSIVAQLLDFSRASGTEMGPVDLNELIRRLLFLMKHEVLKCEIEFRLNLDEALPPICADGNKIAQVIMNLTINAIQAMGNGGILTITTTICSKSAEHSQCCISFHDTGEGIEPENMPFIFDPFFSTKKTGEGTGLGLSVSRGIIEQHGGKMSVESEPGSGTTFTICLPVTQDRSEAVER